MADELLIKARVKDGDNWSALAEATFKVELPEIAPQDPSIDALYLPVLPAVDSWYVAGRICYQLPHEGQTEIQVYTLGGQMVAQTKAMQQSAGIHTTPALALPEGVYVYRIRFEGRDYLGKFRQR